MFAFFGKKKRGEKENAVQNNPALDTSLEKEFVEVYLQTRCPPLGDPASAWVWITEKIRHFQQAGLEKKKLLNLEANVLIYFTEGYKSHFDEFLEIMQDMTAIVLTCELLLSKGMAQKAKEIADPYLRYLEAHPEKYASGLLCFQDALEETIFRMENPNVTEYRQVEDNYTCFITLYIRIIDGILIKTYDEIAERRRKKEKWLNVLREISPCNATVWEALARVYTATDEEQYEQCINKALKYSYRMGSPYGLGAIYEVMAMHQSTKDPQLAEALCVVCEKCEGNPTAARFALHKQNVAQLKEDEAEELVRKAGIQLGFSETVKKAAIIGKILQQDKT